MNNFLEKTTIIVFSFFVIIGFSGCGSNLENNSIEEDVKTLDNERASLMDIDTSNWQTYRNEEYGFEVKYPEDWVYDTDNFNDNEIVSFGQIDCATKYENSSVKECNSSIGIMYGGFNEELMCNIDPKKTPLIAFSSPESKNADCGSFNGTWLYYWYELSTKGSKDLILYIRHIDVGVDPNNNKSYFDWVRSGRMTEYFDYKELPYSSIEKNIFESFRFIEN